MQSHVIASTSYLKILESHTEVTKRSYRKTFLANTVDKVRKKNRLRRKRYFRKTRKLISYNQEPL